MSEEPTREDVLQGVEGATDVGDEDEDFAVVRHDDDFGEAIVSVAIGFASRDAVSAARMEAVGDLTHLARIDAVEADVPESAIDRLRSHPEIRYVERDSPATPDQISSSTTVPWGVDRIDADVAWSNDIEGTGASIAVVDSGIDSDHPDLAPNLGEGWVASSFTECGAQEASVENACHERWDDDYGHGTRVAGCAAAAGTSAGVAGVAPKATLHAVKFAAGDGTGAANHAAEGIEWAAQKGVDVVCLSWSMESTYLREMITYATEQGTLVSTSAGNTGPCTDCITAPSDHPDAMAITASNSTDGFASFSSQGPEADLIAPGVGVETTDAGGGTVSFGGTSASAPYVAGAAALLYSVGYTDPATVRSQLKTTAEDLGLVAAKQGSGLVDAQAATDVNEYVVVRTDEPTAVGDHEATFNATVTDLIHTGSGADVWFEYWTEGGTVQETTRTTVTATGAVSITATGLADHTEYTVQARAQTVTEGASSTGTQRTFETLYDFGDPADANTWLATTGPDGRTDPEIASLPEGSSTFAVDKAGYDVEEGSFDHSGSGRTTIYLTPTGETGDVAGPTTAAHVEIAGLENRTDETFGLPVWLANCGTEAGATEVTLETPTGTRIDHHETTLEGGETRVAHLNARPAFEGGGPVDLVARTSHDETYLSDVEAGGEIAEVIGPGLPATIGSPQPATLGSPLPSTLGRTRDYQETRDVELARVENGTGLTLERASGERLLIEACDNFRFTHKHTSIGQWSVDVPAELDLVDWGYRTKAIITRNGTKFLEGWVDPISLTSSDQSGRIAGYTGAFELTRGEIEHSFGGTVAAYAALQRLAERFLDDWQWHVTKPIDPIQTEPGNLTGSPLEIIEQICNDYGLRYEDDYQELRRIEFYPPGGKVSGRRVPFGETAEKNISRSAGAYAPYVRFQGAGDIEGRAIDGAAIRRIAAEQGISREAAQGDPVQITDTSIESEVEANARASGKLRQLAENNEREGTIESVAEVLKPGVAYSMPWDTDVVRGVHSLRFRSGGAVTLPGDTMQRMTVSGSITAWVKAAWADLGPKEARIVGGNRVGEVGGLQTVGNYADLMLHNRSNSGEFVRASAYPGGPPDDEWWLWHGDWRYSAADDATTVRAGHDGVIERAALLDGKPQIPFLPDDEAWIGAYQDDTFRGLINRVSFWDAQLSTADYETLAARGEIPETDLSSRWPLDEGPHKEPSWTVRDIARGKHGRLNGRVEWGGSPLTLHKIDITDNEATYDFSRQVGSHDNAETLRREVSRLKRQE